MCLLLEFPTPHPQIGWVLTHGPQSHRLIRTHQWQKKLEMMLTSWLGFWRLLSWVPAKMSTFLQFSMQSLVPGLGVVVPIPVFPQQREKSFVSKRNKNATFYMTFFLFFWDFFFGCIFKTCNQKFEYHPVMCGCEETGTFSYYWWDCKLVLYLWMSY